MTWWGSSYLFSREEKDAVAAAKVQSDINSFLMLCTTSHCSYALSVKIFLRLSVRPLPVEAQTWDGVGQRVAVVAGTVRVNRSPESMMMPGA